ncbi:MAG: TolC family protein [Burkholderiales bacterium]|nr:TolC family protein [Burkholderiales bacterium]
MNTRLPAMLVVTALLGGCATFSEDGGSTAVNNALASRGLQQAAPWIRSAGEAERAATETGKLLAQPLTADTAVRVALLNNRGLQARYAELGIAEADLVQAGRLTNPGFGFGRLHRADVVEYERAFIFDLMGLLTMPLRTRVEGERFAATQNRITAEILQVAADTRRAWIRAVAAQQTASYAAQVQSAAEAAAELARRMAAVGNFSKLDQAREQAFYSEATTQLARARQSAVAEREALTRLLGLWGAATAFRLPERLPELPNELPTQLREIADIEGTALAQRLDVQAAARDAEALARNLGLTKATGWFSVLEGKYMRNSESGDPRQTGWEIEMRIPVFDSGSARVARAEHLHRQAVNRAADLAVRARSEVREAWQAWRSSYDIARHYREEVVPLRARISEETLLRYNGMLMSVFELLAESRQQIGAVTEAINAQRDFWLADTTLQFAMTTRSPGMVSAATPQAAATTAARPGH